MAGACLAGVQILCAAPTHEEEKQLRCQVSSLGGTPMSLGEVAGNLVPSHLVATSVLTDAYTVGIVHPASASPVLECLLECLHRSNYVQYTPALAQLLNLVWDLQTQ